MVKKQQLALGGLTCVFSSSRRTINKQQDTASPPSAAAAAAAAATGEVLPWHPSSSSYSAWQWSSCGLHPRTLSFRQQQQQPPAEQEEEDAKNGHGRHRQQQQRAAYCKTMNSVYSVDFSGDSSFASVDSFESTASEAESDAEAVIQALRSDRLLYEPAPAHDIEDDDASCCRLIKQPSPSKHSIKKQKQAAVADNDGDDKPQLDTSSKAPALTTSTAALAFGGATAMSVESHNPYRDFRESMEAMVMSQLGQEGGVKDWRGLEEMLGWYLRANGKTTHGLIVAAFVDLLVALTTSPAAAADYNYSSSSSSSPVATPPDSASATNCSAASSMDDCSCCSSSL